MPPAGHAGTQAPGHPRLLATEMYKGLLPLDKLVPSLKIERPHRVPGTAFFGIPPNRVVEHGMQVQL